METNKPASPSHPLPFSRVWRKVSVVATVPEQVVSEMVVARSVQTAPSEPRAKLHHPWKRAWNIRRQRELANPA